MKHLDLYTLHKVYPNAKSVQIKDAPINQWCYFVFENNGGQIGFAFAKLEYNEDASKLIATDDCFYFILSACASFEYRYDNIDKGIYVCVVELGE